MKKKEIIKRLEALEAIISPKPVLESGWYKYPNTKYLMYHNYETNYKYGFGTYHGWYDHIDPIDLSIDTNEYTKATTQEVEQRLIEEAKRRGLVKGVGIKNHQGEFILDNIDIVFKLHPNVGIYTKQEIGVWLMCNGKWAEVIETKPSFKPVFMKCTQEQFDRMRPKLESAGQMFVK